MRTGNLIAALLVSACGTPSTDPPPVAMGTGQCGTASPAVTSGGSWGEPWVPPRPDLTPSTGFDENDPTAWVDPTVYFPPIEGQLPPENDPVVAPDSATWTKDLESGTWYRRVTEDEVEQNGWSAASLLVLPPYAVLWDVHHAEPEVLFPIPLLDPDDPDAELDFAYADLVYFRQRQHVPTMSMVLRPNGMTVVKPTPLLHMYIDRSVTYGNVGDVVAAAYATSDGDLELVGNVAESSFRLHGPFRIDRGPFTLDVPIPSETGFDKFYLLTNTAEAESYIEAVRDEQMENQGSGAEIHILPQHPMQTVFAIANLAEQCNDGLDNDRTCQADGNDFSCQAQPAYSGDVVDYTARTEFGKEVLFIGDAPFCTALGENWVAEMRMLADTAVQFLNSIQPPENIAPSDRPPPFRVAGIGCQPMVDSLGHYSIARAAECHDNGTNCPPDYQLSGVGSNWTSSIGGEDVVEDSYFGRMWLAAQAWAENMGTAEAHAPSFVVMIAGRERPTTVISGNPDAGLAFAPNFERQEILGSTLIIGPGLGLPYGAPVSSPIDAGILAAHEIGHAFGLNHDTAGFMRTDFDPYSYSPLLDWSAPSLIETIGGRQTQLEAWLRLGGKGYPRPPGHCYICCGNDTQCAENNACEGVRQCN